ncbi:helix-turn-helix transcriptional regulator [Corynebacterium tuberculostearicum]|uniref:Helix-turn-helix transcriptional regulator n=1 Tax=Corynebacterium tuberculostearicum TaxID=38304 RepID=A0AAE4NIJ0_9CORY|nr:helix-turn-helix transcriptional regulator [Corynebacterium tuberculostearicum]MDV2418333.1 helix-turn-helix transcriptional regulator [Corynebacterium tuberculostearicum]
MVRPKTVRPVEMYPDWPLRGDTAARRDQSETLRIAMERLSEVVSARQWSLRQLAAATEVNHVSLHNMLTGHTWPRAEHIAQIELALGISLWPQPEEVKHSSSED